MKKLSLKHRNFLIRKSKQHKKKKRLSIGFEGRIDRIFSAQKYPYKILNRHLFFAAPETLDLFEHYDETVQFMKILRGLSALPYKKDTIDFTTIKSISPLAAILLTSEIHRWQILKGAMRVVNEEKWNPDVKRLLHEMGFFDLVRVVNKPNLHYSESLPVQFAAFRSGKITLGEEADKLRKDIEKMAGPLHAKSLLYGGLTEAMKNVLNWAYTESTPEHLRRWWMSASFHKKDERIIIMIYDHGVGIPATLPRSTIWEKVNAILPGNDDDQMIAAAMQIGRSATNEQHRGKGLADIQRFVLNANIGTLRVISGRGDYSITNKKVETTTSKNISLDGTLIAWEISGQKEDLNV